MGRLCPALALCAAIVLPHSASAGQETRLSVGFGPVLAVESLAKFSLGDGATLHLGLHPIQGQNGIRPGSFRLVPGGAAGRSLAGGLELAAGPLHVSAALGGNGGSGLADVSVGTDLAEGISLQMRWTTAWADPMNTVGQDAATVGMGRSTDLRLTLQHSLAPGLAVSGMAAAVTEQRGVNERGTDLMFGASLSLRF